jgi:hypothetical protein
MLEAHVSVLVLQLVVFQLVIGRLLHLLATLHRLGLTTLDVQEYAWQLVHVDILSPLLVLIEMLKFRF